MICRLYSYVALAPEQVATLTSDIVWLVEREVTLADGSTTRALVPQVYLMPRAGDLDGRGTLIAARDININLSGDLSNSGTIAGRRIMQVSAQNIHNLGGQIGGGQITALTAVQDINNTGGAISAQDLLLLQAGRDVSARSTTQSATNTAGPNTFTRTTLDRVASLTVSNPSGVLQIAAMQDISLSAAQINSAGSTSLQAGQDITLGTVTLEKTDQANWNAKNYLRSSQSSELGTQINGGGAVSLIAGQDLNARAAQVQAAGALTAQAGGDITLSAGQSSQSFEEAHQIKSKGFLSSKTTTTRQSQSDTQALGSSFGGQHRGRHRG